MRRVVIGQEDEVNVEEQKAVCKLSGRVLDGEQKKELEEVLGKYSELFSGKPGKTKIDQHVIHNGDEMPIRSQAYRVPLHWKEEFRKEIEHMLELGVIEPSKSPWASPTVPVRKFDGGLRICIDYRRLNDLTKKDPYRMPLVEELIDEAGNASFLSKIDLVKGYYQIPMEESSNKKTAFVCPFGKYQFNRMPFGLSNAPATFQRVMDKMLSGATEFAKTYIDDIVVFSACWRDHLTHLEEVLKRLKDARLTVNQSKCDWGKSEIEYLGHVVGSGKTSVPQARVSDLRNFKRPGTKKQLRSFLGLVGFYRRFIQDFGKLAQPLYSAIKREMCEQVQWTDQMQESFYKLCNVLSNHVCCMSHVSVIHL